MGMELGLLWTTIGNENINRTWSSWEEFIKKNNNEEAEPRVPGKTERHRMCLGPSKEIPIAEIQTMREESKAGMMGQAQNSHVKERCLIAKEKLLEILESRIDMKKVCKED